MQQAAATRPGMDRGLTIRVVKVGGSLLWCERLGARLSYWLDVQSPAATILVVGGGHLADGVRELDRRYALPSAATHELGVRAMQVNAFLLHQLCPATEWLKGLQPWLEGRTAASSPASPTRAILDPLVFMLEEEPHFDGIRLPCGWEVTSDSIAARIAHAAGATELVLLKSALPSAANGTSVTEAARNGFVDDHFPTAAAGLKVIRSVNFRDDEWPTITLV